MFQKGDHIKYTVVLIFLRIHYLHLMYSEVAWILLFLGTQVQPEILLDPNKLPSRLSFRFL